MDQKEIKSIIKATLISNPLKTTVRQLQRDIFKSEGFEIPYKQFGFTDIVRYLQSIPDTVQVIGSGPLAEVRVVLNEKSAHVAQLVSKQRTIIKKPKFARFKPRIERAKHIYGTRSTYHLESNTRQNGLIPRRGYDQLNFDKEESVDDEEYFEEEELELYHVNNQVNDDVDQKIPIQLQKNLEELIKKFPQGLWCSKLPTEYKKYYRTNLNYADYGFKSLIQLCCELTKVFKFVRPGNGDYILFHIASRSISQPDFREECKLPETKKRALYLEKKPDLSDNLTDVLGNLRLSPPQILPMGEIIPQQEIASKPGEYIDVQIAEVYDPSKFWFNMDIHVDKLDKLMDSLQSFYSENYKTYLIPSCEIQEGLYCVTIYMDEYHRGVITNLMPQSNQSVKVFFFDYGTVSSVSIDRLCYLHRNFAQLPAQAKRGRLANISPPHEHEMWSIEASEYFLDMVRNKVCIAEIYAIEDSSQAYELVVANTSSDKDIYINDSLVNAGYALYVHQVKEQKKKRISNKDLLKIMKEMVNKSKVT